MNRLSVAHYEIAMKILDPNLKDGVHEWRDGKRFVKEGVKLYLEGTDTLAGRQRRLLFVFDFDARTTYIRE